MVGVCFFHSQQKHSIRIIRKVSWEKTQQEFDQACKLPDRYLKITRKISILVADILSLTGIAKVLIHQLSHILGKKRIPWSQVDVFFFQNLRLKRVGLQSWLLGSLANWWISWWISWYLFSVFPGAVFANKGVTVATMAPVGFRALAEAPCEWLPSLFDGDASTERQSLEGTVMDDWKTRNVSY